MTVLRAELRAHARSTLIWAGSLSLVVTVFMGIYPTFARDVETSKQLLTKFPPVVRAMFGLSLEKFFTVSGFFAYILTFVTLVAAVQAASLGVAAISREEAGKTSDFLLTKPLSRARIVTEKLVAVVLLLLATNVVFDLVALTVGRTVAQGDLDAGEFLLVSGAVPVVQAAFFAIGVFLSVVVPKVRSVPSVALPTVFTFFVIGLLDSVLGSESIRYLTPFKFVDPLYVIDHHAYEGSYLLAGAGAVVALIAVSYVLYARKDLRAVA